MDYQNFTLDFEIRLQIQYDLFGYGDFKRANERLYRYVWENSIHCCHESGRPLHNYSSVYISHIISRGSDRRMAIDPRNVNVLSYDMHQQWETGKRKEMNIYRENLLIMEILRKDYNLHKNK